MGTSRRVVIIPAFNEEASIFQVVKEARNFADVIVVDDGSQDATASRAREAGALVVTQVNGGYEASLERGFQEASRSGYSFALTMDADGQHPAQFIPAFFGPLEQGEAELVLGVRPRPARLAEKALASFFRLRFGVKDPLCGMKAYRLIDYQSVGAFDRQKCVGMELMYKLLLRPVRFQQIPIPHQDRQNGEPRYGRRFQANWKILSCWFRLLSSTRETQHAQS